MPMNLNNSDISQISEALQRRELSAVELCEEYFRRISAHSDLNAFISLNEEGALEQAKTVDQMRTRSPLGTLAGIPVAHKDIFCTKDIKTTCGSKILENFVSPYDATLVSLLKDQNTIILGKTNMDEFAMGSSTEHSYFNSTKNPWDLSRVPGGSSGGSAAAVAARMAPVATGTDTGGSVRQPAALCGICGIKPSYGRISRYGMVAFASSLDQAGFLGKTAKDLAIFLDASCGFDPKDSTSLEDSPSHCLRNINEPLGKLTIGVPEEYFADGLDATVGSVIEAALSEFEALGARLIQLSMPNSKFAIPCYYVIAPAEASSNLSRYDGVRYGYRSSGGEGLSEMYSKSRSEGFGLEVQRRIMIGTYVLSHGYYDAYYVKAQKVRRLISEDYRLAFENCDLIMGPTTPTTAFKIGAKTQDPVHMYLNDIYTAAVNLAGLPAVSIPAGFDGSNLPVGLHIVAPYLQESRLLQVAHLFQKHTDFHLQSPVAER